MDGIINYQNKTLPPQFFEKLGRERNEKICETQSRIIVVPVVVEPVPVELDLVVVLDEVRDVEVAVAVPHNMCTVPSMPPPFEACTISELNII